jgi:exodeoxyribonuclease VII small subunit
MEPTIKDFETAIAELEGIVKKLEEGDLTLEASLELYERGVHLSRYCHARLEDAERRIEILNERGELRPAGTLGKDEESARGGAPDSPRDEPLR